MYYLAARCFTVRVTWREFWKVAIILLINNREKKEPVAVHVLMEYNAERQMTDFANHSSFCFEVIGPLLPMPS